MYKLLLFPFLYRRHTALGIKLSSESLSPSDLKVLGKEYSELTQVVLLMDDKDKCIAEIKELEQLVAEESLKGSEGQEIADMARAEASASNLNLDIIEEKILRSLIPSDKDDDKGVVIEVRAGTGKA
jgi:peptide chain release factor 1